ncbi:MAG: type II toxin-antitoxin system HipA family toxin [Rhodoferax sp.]|nr:type II toxin-antitoxin system HipA family toxin [Rhodoferax sp.]OIP16281.1 MAG: hypothetical protein AUK50_09385 [Comamonadaceae bacterium CG2_30_57_122]PJC13363.1 MAG: type II toxin-antitoxin system HipA family toxin [Comamonadaceae bacterium CG_4_9_14_0_8_um_filter_57_21]
MSGITKPVWVWLPDTHAPTACGTFTLQNKIGTFTYLQTYRATAGAVSLDPHNLPLTRATGGRKETRQGGLFGVFRDASPEGFGLGLLERLKNINIADPMQRLELSEGDAVGAIEVCDDIQAKCAFQPPALDDLVAALASLEPERASSVAAREVKGVKGTSLGGERPKLTVMHGQQQWIAKLQDRGDPPHAPLREYLAMRLAKRCGIRAAQVEFKRVGDREMVLVRRFDRAVTAQGLVSRKLYASAHTVLRLDTQLRGDPQRSYIALSNELQRWCGRSGYDPKQQQRELWRRMAFNAIVGNADDHPRNHGLLYENQGWVLSDAFDIAPYLTFSKTLSMAMTRDGSLEANAGNLLKNCTSFHYEAEEARHYIKTTVATIRNAWPEELAAVGMPHDAAATPAMDWLGDALGIT